MLLKGSKAWIRWLLGEILGTFHCCINLLLLLKNYCFFCFFVLIYTAPKWWTILLSVFLKKECNIYFYLKSHVVSVSHLIVCFPR